MDSGGLPESNSLVLMLTLKTQHLWRPRGRRGIPDRGCRYSVRGGFFHSLADPLRIAPIPERELVGK
jgi:hypothetical protein